MRISRGKTQWHTQLFIALNQCNKAIVHCTNQEELFLQICHIAVQFGGMKMAWVGLIDTETRMIRLVSSFGDTTEYLKDIKISVDDNSPLGHGPTGTATRENLPYWCQDIQNDPRTVPWREIATRAGLAASASLPLHRNGLAIGNFNLYSGKVNSFDESVRIRWLKWRQISALHSTTLPEKMSVCEHRKN